MRSSCRNPQIPTRLGILLPVLALFLLFTPTSVFADEIKDLIRKATNLTRAGSTIEAEQVLKKALEIDPNRSDAKLELAYVYVKQHRIRDAYDLTLPIAKAEPRNPHAFAVLGATMLVGGRFKEARALFYTAIELNKHEDLAWAGFGMVDFYENRIDDSLSHLREAVFEEPNEPDYLFTLAQVSARSERYREAADAYHKFLRISKSTDADRRARIKGLIQFLEYLGNVGGLYLASGEEQTTVPFQLVGNRPVIRLRINDNPEPLQFVLDTGSGISVISEETARRFKIKAVARGGMARGIGGDGKFEIVYGQLRQLDIGNVTVRNVPVYIRKFHPLGNEHIDGYVGLALISKFLTTIDYGTNTFTLTRRDEDRRDFLANDTVSVPLRLTSSGFLSGEVQLAGIESPLNFIVDTGASVSVISRAVSNEENISTHANDERLRVVGSAGVTENVPTFLLPKVSFGANSMEGVKCVALDLDVINEASGFEQAGILGGNFLKNYRLTFDFRNSKVSFVPTKADKE